MNVIIFGPPGAGKGTQAQNLVKKLNLYQLSTGDLLRSEIKKKTEIGKKIKQIIAQGDFVTDDIVNELLKKFITSYNYRNKIIFDGYPRSLSQAKNLRTLLESSNQKIDLIIFLNVHKETIIKRITNRAIEENRGDDIASTIKTRILKYNQETLPVSNFYKNQYNSVYYSINGNQEIAKLKQENANLKYELKEVA